jgi:hypothetical protein
MILIEQFKAAMIFNEFENKPIGLFREKQKGKSVFLPVSNKMRVKKPCGRGYTPLQIVNVQFTIGLMFCTTGAMF